MAATDQHYRSQKTLDLIFGISCAALLLSTLWMFANDHYREFKSVQRTFRDVESAIAERDMVSRLPDVEEVNDKRLKLVDARKKLKEQKESAEFQSADSEKKAKREQTDEKYREIKADYDSLVSSLNIARDEVGHYPLKSEKATSLSEEAKAALKRLEDKEKELNEAKAAFDAADLAYREHLAKIAKFEKSAEDAAEDLKRTTGVFDRFAKLATQKAWGTGDAFRGLPIIDGFAAPTKVNQQWLPDLTIDYGGFRDVPRYDRCTTCHLGIDRPTFDRETLTRLGDEQESAALNRKLRQGQAMLIKRQASGETLGFDPMDLPGEPYAKVTPIVLLMLLCVLVGALSLGILQRSVSLGVRSMAAGSAVTLITALCLVVFSPRVTAVKSVKLNDSQVNQYCAHPRLDLFVSANSPHSAEKFGCTICHAGQGSATEFLNVAHTPATVTQEHRWKKQHGWEDPHAGEFPPNYHWDFPMLSKRFTESSCLKCHYQVSELVRDGVRDEAPKLTRGYNIIKEVGCFGCHEIQGMKGGRQVGPDMRLEPSPALDWLAAQDQERIKNDAANPPGTLRKVGPSLRRLAEKSNEEFTRQWVLDPRGFREDTRMPHFYEIGTNDKDKLPDDQKKFPDAEIFAVSHYLIVESQKSLQSKDSVRESLLRGPNNIGVMQERLIKSGLADKEMKELFELSKRFSDLALLTAPMNNKSITEKAQRQRQLQERLRELHQAMTRSGGATDAAKKDAQETASELVRVTRELEEKSQPFTLASGKVLGDSGELLDLPQGNADLDAGKKLFIEKGCLACHAHQGTSKASAPKGSKLFLDSDAEFGPELSRIALKIKPGQDQKSAQAWLVQWLLNPNVYHPRTKMPITHLSPKEASDIAGWLLSQQPAWKGKEPATPTNGDLQDLARVFLSRVAWLSEKEQEAAVPKGATTLDKAKHGIPADKLKAAPRDAEEHALVQGNVTRETLLWYVGKKAIGRLGCYACHDIPGFEQAKPIGVGLNDWGKKDHERLAFEDAHAWAKKKYNVVSVRGLTRAEVEERMKPSLERKEELTKAEEAIPKIRKTLEKTAGALPAWKKKSGDANALKQLAAELTEVQKSLESVVLVALQKRKSDLDLQVRPSEAGLPSKARITNENDKLRIKKLADSLDFLGNLKFTLEGFIAGLGQKEAVVGDLTFGTSDSDRLTQILAMISFEFGNLRQAMQPDEALLGKQKRIVELQRKKVEQGLTAAEERELAGNPERIAELQRKKSTTDLTPEEERELSDLLSMATAADQFFEPVDNRPPFEELFFQALHHHRREGFLPMKLMDPRSYDYNRRLKWDDRSRMPQFQFARTRRKPGESEEAYKSRHAKAEAEAREAVMTFVFGLVAEPIPLKYVYAPKGDRLAEVTGRQVLEKYNCGGCHQIRPGAYDFAVTKDTLANLMKAHGEGPGGGKDHAFASHSAWYGQPQTSERLTAFGFPNAAATSELREKGKKSNAVWLTEALKFTGADGVARDVPAGAILELPEGASNAHSPYGGTFTDLMVNLMTVKGSPYPVDYDTDSKARSALPPPLVRQGERVQPDWMYRFLLHPGVIRPTNVMRLRMPKFNMSPDEARALVNYFAAVSKTTNPAAGITYPYVQIDQREPEFWTRKAEEYASRLQGHIKDQEARRKVLEGDIATLQKKVGDPALAKEAASNKKLLDERKQDLATAEKEIKEVSAFLDPKRSPPPANAKVKDLYSRSAFHLVIDKNLCISCHDVGTLITTGPKGPNLALAAERLRPEWVEQWVAHPRRMFPYDPVMPQNFTRDENKFQDLFRGTSRQQVTAVRDLILSPDRMQTLINAEAPEALKNPPKTGDAKK